MAADREQREKTRWLRELAQRYAYEGARQIEVHELVAFTCVLNAIYVTPDSVDRVDSWYREKLELGSLSDCDIGAKFHIDGRRWSYFRDGCKFKKEPSIKPGPMTVRQIIFDEGGVRYVVLAVRPAGADLTQISLTVLPGEGAQDEASASSRPQH